MLHTRGCSFRWHARVGQRTTIQEKPAPSPLGPRCAGRWTTNGQGRHRPLLPQCLGTPSPEHRNSIGHHNSAAVRPASRARAPSPPTRWRRSRQRPGPSRPKWRSTEACRCVGATLPQCRCQPAGLPNVRPKSVHTHGLQHTVGDLAEDRHRHSIAVSVLAEQRQRMGNRGLSILCVPRVSTQPPPPSEAGPQTPPLAGSRSAEPGPRFFD